MDTSEMSQLVAKEVILHIGASKTGTTSLQAAFFNSIKQFERLQIAYPIYVAQESFAWRAQRGMGNGNGDIFSENPWMSMQPFERLSELIKHAVNAEQSVERYLISSENLSKVAVSEAFWASLGALQVNNRLKIGVIMYLRDPLPMLLSCYQQVVKLAGFSGSLSDFLVPFFSEQSPLTFYTHANIKKICDYAIRYEVPLTVFRYEELSTNIVSHFYQTVLGIREEVEVEGIARLNLSLDPVDVEFHRGINTTSKRLGTLIGWERSDSLLAGKNASEESDLGVFRVDERDEMLFKQHVERYIADAQTCLEFAERVNDSFHHRFISPNLSSSQIHLNAKVFQLGKIIGQSYETGYLKWDHDGKIP